MGTAARRSRSHVRSTQSALMPPRSAIPTPEDVDVASRSIAGGAVPLHVMRQPMLVGLLGHADDEVSLAAAHVLASRHAQVFRGAGKYTSKDTPPPGFASVTDERLSVWISEPIEKRFPDVTHAARLERHRRKAKASRKTTQFLVPPGL